jgi:hypothetical protein
LWEKISKSSGRVCELLLLSGEIWGRERRRERVVGEGTGRRLGRGGGRRQWVRERRADRAGQEGRGWLSLQCDYNSVMEYSDNLSQYS